jgi:16S rRNA (cytidine1402-2'-O)-methyltransferase
MIYLVATPIGNLGDISMRALETLRTVDVIASEDTRHTAILLHHYDIKKPQIAFHAHNEARVLPHLMQLHAEGKSIALVTDAGTPGISDPGFSLVRRAVEAGAELTMIPGAAALVMAVVLSGLPAHAFTYRGFPPRKRGPRLRFLAVDQDAPHTLVFYESPYRLLATLEDAVSVYGDRPGAVANDLTKRFEAVERGNLRGLLERLRPTRLRGEYTLVIAGAGYRAGQPERDEDNETDDDAINP